MANGASETAKMAAAASQQPEVPAWKMHVVPSAGRDHLVQEQPRLISLPKCHDAMGEVNCQ